MERFIGVVGFVALILFAVILSNNRRRISLHTLVVGLLLQGGIGVLLLYWEKGRNAVLWLAEQVTACFVFAERGTAFLFGHLADTDHAALFGFQFAWRSLPLVLFFSTGMTLLFHFRIMQQVVRCFTVIMSRVMKTSGVESLVACANIFIGQTEAPFLVRPFLKTCTRSELAAIMVSGFGTVSAAAMMAIIGMGISAEQMIIASCMAAPASLVVAKIIFPETEQVESSGKTKLSSVDVGPGVVDAVARGVSDGLHVVLNVAAMLVVFIALVALADKVLGWADRLIDGVLLCGAVLPNGEYAGYVPGSLRTLFGTLLAPLAFAMGVPRADCAEVGNLLGLKLSTNEFVAYTRLVSLVQAGAISQKATMMATAMLCGFANVVSIGVQVGSLGALEPTRRSDVAMLGLRTMLGGVIVSCLTATMIGLLVG